MPNHMNAAPRRNEPNTITVEQARAEGVSPQRLRQVAKWNAWQANKVKSKAVRMRMSAQADELQATACKLEVANDNGRRGA